MGKGKDAIKRDYTQQFIEKGNGKNLGFNQGILKEISRNITHIRPNNLGIDQPEPNNELVVQPLPSSGINTQTKPNNGSRT